MTFDAKAQVLHWWVSAEEEMEFVEHALKWRHSRQAMFHAHLALELALKAAVCKAISDTPPKIHDLVKLAGHASLLISEEQRGFLGEMNKFNISGRYTDPMPSEPPHEQAVILAESAKEFIEWLKSQLFKV